MLTFKIADRDKIKLIDISNALTMSIISSDSVINNDVCVTSVHNTSDGAYEFDVIIGFNDDSYTDVVIHIHNSSITRMDKKSV